MKIIIVAAVRLCALNHLSEYFGAKILNIACETPESA
jgi:hypothetical protein